MKLPISPEWTPRERLQVIHLLSSHALITIEAQGRITQTFASDFFDRIRRVGSEPAAWLNKNTGGIFEGMGIERVEETK